MARNSCKKDSKTTKKRKIFVLMSVFRHKSLVFPAYLFSFAGKDDCHENGMFF